MKKIAGILLISAALAAGCATQTQTGAAVGTGVGAAVGAGLGQAIGGNTKGTLIGAAVGAAAGGLTGAAVGRYMDKQEQAMRQAIANSEAASIRREQDVLAVTFKSDYLFDVNSATMLSGAYREIERVSKVLAQYPETMIQVAGHTDSSGGADYNQKLSERRAESVKKAIVGTGVNASRLTTVGFGESRPVASNNTEAGRQQNRRVELRIMPQQK